MSEEKNHEAMPLLCCKTSPLPKEGDRREMKDEGDGMNMIMVIIHAAI